MSLAVTTLQDLVAFSPRYASAITNRFSQYGAWRAFKDDTDSPASIISSMQREEIMRSMGQTTKLIGYNQNTAVVTNVRSCTIPNAENTTAFYTVVFVTYVSGFTMNRAQYESNYVGFLDDFALKMDAMERAFLNELDLAGLAVIQAGTNQVFPFSTPYGAPVANLVQVPQLVKNTFYNELNALFLGIDYPTDTGFTRLVCNAPHTSLLSFIANQGGSNSTNLEFQLPGFTPYVTNNLANGVGVESTVYGCREGYLATLRRLDPDALRGGSTLANGTDANSWGTFMLPRVGEVGVKYTQSCADWSAVNAATPHLTASNVEGWSFSFDQAFVIAYNNDLATISQPIIGAQILS